MLTDAVCHVLGPQLSGSGTDLANLATCGTDANSYVGKPKKPIPPREGTLDFEDTVRSLMDSQHVVRYKVTPVYRGSRTGWPAAATAAVSAVLFLVVLLGDGVRDAASAQVGAEASGAVGLVGDDLVGPAAWAALTGAWDADAFQQGACADAVVALAGRQQDREGPTAAVAGEVDFGGQSSSGSAEGVIVRFVRPVGPPFRPVAAACWWARTIVESICTIPGRTAAGRAERSMQRFAWHHRRAPAAVHQRLHRQGRRPVRHAWAAMARVM
jgi:hypothetical protein